LCYWYGLKAIEAASSSMGEAKRRQVHAGSFAKVFDARKHAIRRLWVRNGRFYAQLKVENPITGIKKTRRVPLMDKDGEPVQTAAPSSPAPSGSRRTEARRHRKRPAGCQPGLTSSNLTTADSKKPAADPAFSSPPIRSSLYFSHSLAHG
jgi:hypothetical protein